MLSAATSCMRNAAVACARSTGVVPMAAKGLAVRLSSSHAGASLAGKSVYRAAMFDRPILEGFVEVCQKMHAMPRNAPPGVVHLLLQGSVMGKMFFEPSTRTAASFQNAMQRLGGTVLSVDATTSSAKKGETMHDTIKVMEQYADVIVLRHQDEDAMREAMEAASVPVINAGDGACEHPTQALLDTFCIHDELGVASLDNLTITLVGDLKFGRTVHSLIQLLALYDNVTVNLVSPKELAMPTQYLDLVDGRLNIAFHDSYHHLIPDSDVLYLTRVQQERFGADRQDEYERLKHHYVLKPEHMESAKENMAIMHPLPRVGEIDPRVDEDPRAAYFRQVRAGLSARMALLACVLGRV